MRKLALLLLMAAVVGCSSSEPKKAEEGAKPAAAAQPAKAELQTGRTAFYEMYRNAAHTWSPDAKPFRVQSSPTKDAQGVDGKAEVWHAWFASPTKGKVKPYTWSGGTGDDLPEKGVSFGAEDTFNPNNVSTQPFDVQFLKSDSDQAFKAAQEHGGEALLKKDPKMPITYTLDWAGKANELIWHVTYGNPQEYKLKIAVNASTGEFLRKER